MLTTMLTKSGEDRTINRSGSVVSPTSVVSLDASGVMAGFFKLLSSASVGGRQQFLSTLHGHVARGMHFGADGEGGRAEDNLSAAEFCLFELLRSAVTNAACSCSGAWRTAVRLLGDVPYARLRTQRSECSSGHRLTFLREAKTTVFTLKGGSLPGISEVWECKICRAHFYNNSKRVFPPLRRAVGLSSKKLPGSEHARTGKTLKGVKRSADSRPDAGGSAAPEAGAEDKRPIVRSPCAVSAGRVDERLSSVRAVALQCVFGFRDPRPADSGMDCARLRFRDPRPADIVFLGEVFRCRGLRGAQVFPAEQELCVRRAVFA